MAIFIVSFYLLLEFIRCDVVSDVLPIAETIPLESFEEQQLFLASPVVSEERIVELVDHVIVFVDSVLAKLHTVREAVHTDVRLRTRTVYLHLLADILLACIAVHSVRGVVEVLTITHTQWVSIIRRRPDTLTLKIAVYNASFFSSTFFDGDFFPPFFFLELHHQHTSIERSGE